MHVKVKRERGLITKLRVRTLSARATGGRLVSGTLSIPCVLGRAGTTWRKREGDGATPAGEHRLVRLRVRSDRLARNPAPRLPVAALAPDDGWCDAPDHPRYNRPVRLPFAASHERLWREDGLYDVIGVLDWNLAPATRGRGSAIFLHLAGDGPTAGCIALRRADLLKLLGRLAPGCRIRVG